MRSIGVILLFAAAVFAAPPAALTETQHLDFPQGGTLKMVNSSGELVIEAWDQPGIEIVTTKSVKPGSDGREFDRVKINAERKDNDVVVTTTMPAHSRFLRLFEGKSDYDVEYQIRLPRTAKLEISHDMGEVHILGVTGEIHASAGMGLISVQLPQEGSYSIDAKSKLGSVISDFEGSGKRERLFGREFAAGPSGATQKLRLSIGYGDVMVLKLSAPKTPLS